MTSTVIIEANHGWPVSVIALTTSGTRPMSAQVVAAGETGRFSVHSGQDLLISEVQPSGQGQDGTDEPLLRYFRFEHLIRELQIVSEPFGLLAHRLVRTLPRGPERTVALGKLLEAKDAAVRAGLPPEAETGAGG
jgi:hypothetical protein